MKIEGVQQIVAKLQAMVAKSITDDNVSVIVGYTAAYGVHVHENLTAYHPVGQAKFLEEPARLLQPRLKDEIFEQLKRGRTMAQALLVAGLRLQRESMKLCPVDTGALRASAFTRLEKGRGEESVPTISPGESGVRVIPL